jgi:hypothetical protein
MSNTAIKLKKSSVSGKAPDSADLQYGELAINYTDGRVYYKNSSNEIKNFIDSDLILSAITAETIQKLNLTGGTMSGNINMNSNRITNHPAPNTGGDLVTKTYVDQAILDGIEGIDPATFPVGDYGSVDSAVFLDAFGQSFGADLFDMLTAPTNQLSIIELGTDSSI